MPSCTACGHEVADGANFCEHCGQPASEAEPVATEVKDPSSGPLFEVRISQYFKTGWQIFLQYPAGFIGFTLIFMMGTGFLMVLQTRLHLLGYLLTAVLSPLHVGLYIVAARLLQRQPCRIGDFFAGFHYLQPLIIFGLIYGIVGGLETVAQQLVWRLLCSLISVGFGVLFLFTSLLIVDRRLGVWQAMDLSLHTVQRRWPQFLGFILLGALLIVTGVIALGVGVLVTLPWFSCAITAAYADLFGLQSQEY